MDENPKAITQMIAHNNDIDTLRSLQLNENLEVEMKGCFCTITRVPFGWVYTFKSILGHQVWSEYVPDVEAVADRDEKARIAARHHCGCGVD